MKLELFEEILELNRAFQWVIAGLDRLKTVPFFQRDLIQHARSGVEIARVYANRGLFDNFEAIVENDAKWAYRFQRDFDRKLEDPDDIYLEVRDSEARRKRKALHLASSSSPIGICPTKTDTTRSNPRGEKVQSRGGAWWAKSSPRKLDLQREYHSVLQRRRQGGAAHERAEAGQPGLPQFRSRSSLSGLTWEGRGLGRTQI